MTVTAKNPVKRISGSGWVNPLTHDFMLENSSYLKVYADDVQLTLGLDYSISGLNDPAGYSVTISDVARTPTYFVLSVETPITQEADVDQGGLFGARFEAALDAVVRRLQVVGGALAYTLKIDRTATPPTKGIVPEAGKIMGWDSGGEPTNYILPSNTPPLGYGDVIGALSSVAGRVVTFLDATGKRIADGGILLADLATKTYVDGIAAGLAKRASVRVATTGNVVIATALNNGDSIDGVALVTGDLVLVKSQSAPAENGVYVVGVAPARDVLFDTYNEHPGVVVAVEEGTANADSLWLCTSNRGGTLGVTAITFSGAITIADATITYAKLAAAAIATSAEYLSNAASKLLTPAAVWGAMTEVALTETDIVNGVNLSTGIDFTVTLTASRVMGAFTSVKVGQRGRIRVVQNATGGWTLTKNANHKTAGGAAIALATTANGETYLYYDCVSATKVLLSYDARVWS